MVISVMLPSFQLLAETHGKERSMQHPIFYRRAFWADRPAHEEALRKNLLSLATTKTRHIGDDPKIELYDPDLWTDEYAFLNAHHFDL